MVTISGFILLCLLQAGLAQRRVIPGRGDQPGPTPPPIPPTPKGCESEWINLAMDYNQVLKIAFILLKLY